MHHVLFVCTAGQKRSPTAAAMWWGHDSIITYSSGIEGIWSWDWQNLEPMVICFEEYHREAIRPHYDGPILVLGIEDKYGFMYTDLIQLIRERVGDILPPPVMDAAYMESLLKERSERV